MRPVLLLLLASLLAAAQELRPPLTVDDLLKWAKLAEAYKPTEEIVAAIKLHSVASRATVQDEAAIRQACESSSRPADLVRQIIDAYRDNWIFDRLKFHVRARALDQIAQIVYDRGIEFPFSPQSVRELRQAGADEPILTMIWPPVAPPKPDFPNQEWRTPGGLNTRAPLQYNAEAPYGTVDLDLMVDSRVIIVLKHQSLFYNVACGRDLQVNAAQFSTPLPHLPPDQWDYRVLLKDAKRQRGGKSKATVYTCPGDPRCSEGDRDTKRQTPLCLYRDLAQAVDERGFANARFVVDDQDPGASQVFVTFQWAVRPYQMEWLLDDLKSFGAARTKDKVYARGASFRLDAPGEQALREAGADQRLIDEVKRNFRGSNWR
jgi:hypothetical protein